jgi:hypothetical protein
MNGAFERSRSWLRLCFAGSLAFGRAGVGAASFAQAPAAFDGRRWDVSSGNLSVSFIQASPIGAFPRPDFLEAPPSVESQAQLRNLGLVANAPDAKAWTASSMACGLAGAGSRFSSLIQPPVRPRRRSMGKWFNWLPTAFGTTRPRGKRSESKGRFGRAVCRRLRYVPGRYEGHEL